MNILKIKKRLKLVGMICVNYYLNTVIKINVYHRVNAIIKIRILGCGYKLRKVKLIVNKMMYTKN